jgi:uncharacterized peroxidase-related enzyme
MLTHHDSPKPVTDVVTEGTAEAFLPYPDLGPDLDGAPIYVRPLLEYYRRRMGFLPNTLKLYLHVPWAAGPLFGLNDAIMRDERSGLTEHFKYRLALLASSLNDCEYCTAHHAATLTRRWGYDEAALEAALTTVPADAREAAAFDFVQQASLDPSTVTDEQRRRLAEHFTPQEAMEIVLVVGFWKMYNTMHTAMAAPLEDPVLDFARWIDVRPGG